MPLDAVKLLRLEAERADIERGEVGNGNNSRLQALVAKGWRITYAELFGQSFVDSLDSAATDDKHHSEAIGWHWNARIALLEGDTPPNGEYAYFPIWSRGNMKSSVAEAMVAVDALLTVAYGQKGYCLYIGREKDRVKENIGNLEALLSRKKIREYAPELSEVAKNEETNSKRQWTGTMLQTKAGYVIKGGTIDSAQAGSRIKHIEDESERDTRVTFFVPDDIDSREDSPVIAETRFNKLTTEILPMGQENTLTFFAQNLISRYSVMYKIQKGGAKVLTNRKPTQPIPAVRGLAYEQRTVNGIVKDVVIAGKPTWRVWDLARVQKEIDTMGLTAFLRECQHEVDQSREGLVHKRYNDDVHPISYSQFAAVFGSRDAWKSWFKVPFSDWARTKTKYHANVAGYLAVSSQNTLYPGLTFCLPMSFKADTEPADVAERLLRTLTPYAVGQKTWKDLIDEAWKRAESEQHFDTVAERIEYTKTYYSQIIPKYSRPVLEKFNVRTGANSHSEDKVREIFNAGFGFSFIPSNPPATAALEQIDEAMRVDAKQPHLFKPNQKGYTRWYVLCPDDTSAKPQQIGDKLVYPPLPYPQVLNPDDLHDSDLFRYQMCNRRFASPKLTETGERIDDLLKLDDDFGQALQLVYFKHLLSNISLTETEAVEEAIRRISPQLTVANMQERSPYANSFTPGQQMARLEVEVKVRKDLEMPNETLNALNGAESFDDGEFDFGFGGY